MCCDWVEKDFVNKHCFTLYIPLVIVQRFSRAGPRGRGREWATLGVHPLFWLLSNNRLEEVCSTLTKGTFSSRLLLSNQVKGCSPSVAHSLPLPLGPALLNLSIISRRRSWRPHVLVHYIWHAFPLSCISYRMLIITRHHSLVHHGHTFKHIMTYFLNKHIKLCWMLNPRPQPWQE